MSLKSAGGAANRYWRFRMMKAAMVAMASLLWGAAALAQAPGTASPPATQDFVNKVAISDMFEIQSRQLVIEKQADRDTKPFAQKMIKDHQNTSKELGALIDKATCRRTCRPGSKCSMS